MMRGTPDDKMYSQQWRVLNAHAHPCLFNDGVILFSLKAVFNILHTSSEPDAQNFDSCSMITSFGLNISIISGLMHHTSLLIQRNVLA